MYGNWAWKCTQHVVSMNTACSPHLAAFAAVVWLASPFLMASCCPSMEHSHGVAHGMVSCTLHVARCSCSRSCSCSCACGCSGSDTGSCGGCASERQCQCELELHCGVRGGPLGSCPCRDKGCTPAQPPLRTHGSAAAAREYDDALRHMAGLSASSKLLMQHEDAETEQRLCDSLPHGNADLCFPLSSARVCSACPRPCAVAILPMTSTRVLCWITPVWCVRMRWRWATREAEWRR